MEVFFAIFYVLVASHPIKTYGGVRWIIGALCSSQ